MISWDDYRVFLALRREGSVARAARRLGVDGSTVRRRLGALEAALGTQLVQRRRHATTLTRAGERLWTRALALESTCADIERELGGSDDKAEGVVKLTAGEAFVTRLIAPALGRFVARHPELRLELYADNQRVDLVRGEADVALRLVRPTDESLVARKVGTLAFGLYASRAYLSRHGRPRSEAELARHAFVAFDASLERTPETQWLLARQARLHVRSNSPVAILVAAAAGLGIAAVSSLFAATEPALERVLPKLELPRREIWLVTHRELSRTARVRALQAFLGDLLQ